MQIDPASLDPKTVHKLMIGTVVPRPIAWITSHNGGGAWNAAPFSYFNAVSSRPCVVSTSFSYKPHSQDGHKDTLNNILETGEYCINVVNGALAEAMNLTSTDYPSDYDELGEAGLSHEPCQSITGRRISGSPVAFECRLRQSVQVGEGPGSATLVLGDVLQIHVADSLVDQGYRVDIRGLDPGGRLAGDGYSYTRELFELVRRPFRG